MAGCKSLSVDEISLVLNALQSNRDKALFILGIRSGFRISELLSLRVSDVVGKSHVTVGKQAMKGKAKSRTIVLHPQAREAIALLAKDMKPEHYLFKSKKGNNRPITRAQAWLVIKEAFSTAGITGKAATHSMRKTFAEQMYKALEFNIYKTSKALGHASIDTTAKYLSVEESELDAVVLALP